MQKKNPSPFSGLLLVNKPQGPTSHDLVAKFRRIVGTKAIGHAGTLDPMAEGLMVLLVGEATKVSQWVTTSSKSYEGVISLGSETTTDDAEGEVIAEFTKKTASEDEVQKVFKSLAGPQSLAVPKFSAIKQEGKKLYEMARKGFDVKTPTRVMDFMSSHLDFIEDHEIGFQLSCSKGSYVRSWAVEVGRRLNSGAHLKKLKRVSCGSFKLEGALSLEQAEGAKDLDTEAKKDWFIHHPAFVPLVESLPEAEILRLNPSEEKLFSNGQIPHGVSARLIPLSRQAFRKEQGYLVRVIGAGGRLAGLLSLDVRGQVRIQRVFQS